MVYPPLSCIAVPDAVLVGQPVTVQATGGSGSYDWDAPGGLPSAGQAQSFTTTFATNGTKSIAVEAGLETSCSVQVADWPKCQNIANALPFQPVTFVGSGGLGPYVWWAGGDALVQEGEGPTFTTVYVEPGLHLVRLTSAGITTNCWVLVPPPPALPYPEPLRRSTLPGDAAPVALLRQHAQTCATSDVLFDATASQDADGNVAAWQWDFGDGQVADGRMVHHRFPGPGEYRVTLTVTDDEGFANVQTSKVLVSPCQTLAAPVMPREAAVDPCAGCAPRDELPQELPPEESPVVEKATDPVPGSAEPPGPRSAPPLPVEPAQAPSLWWLALLAFPLLLLVLLLRRKRSRPGLEAE